VPHPALGRRAPAAVCSGAGSRPTIKEQAHGRQGVTAPPDRGIGGGQASGQTIWQSPARHAAGCVVKPTCTLPRPPQPRRCVRSPAQPSRNAYLTGTRTSFSQEADRAIRGKRVRRAAYQKRGLCLDESAAAPASLPGRVSHEPVCIRMTVQADEPRHLRSGHPGGCAGRCHPDGCMRQDWREGVQGSGHGLPPYGGKIAEETASAGGAGRHAPPAVDAVDAVQDTSPSRSLSLRGGRPPARRRPAAAPST
jgi:hypothetical protein